MIFEFSFVIYPRKLWVTYDASIEELQKKLIIDSDDALWEDNQLDGFADTVQVYSNDINEEQGILIRFDGKESMTSSIMGHEAIHAANYVYDFIGADIDIDNDEPYAYLVEYIINCCESVRLK